MSAFVSARIAHFSAYFASSGPAETPLHLMTPQQKIALATQIRAGHADAIFKVTHGPVSENEVNARKNFFANADVQRKLVKGWIHGTMREPAIIDAMKETGVVLTKDACEKIWYAKSALMLDTFQHRLEALSVLPLLKNLSIQQKCEIADSCLEPCREHVIRQTRQVRLYCQSLKKDEAFRELATDVSNNIYVEYGFRYELAQFLKRPENTKKAKKKYIASIINQSSITTK